MRKADFTTLLLQNYDPKQRPMPWKGISDPYLIWLSEVILQQTRVDQGWNYFLKFKKQYPHISDLANAKEDDVLKLWEGLGYYSRARNLLAAARYVEQELNGIFPNNYTDILKLKGVGPYTAAAIASFAFGERKAVLDGNVYRVLSRCFGISTAIDSTKGKKEFEKLSDELIDAKKPALYNQAIMDFGAEICLPKNPRCSDCPLQNECYAYNADEIAQFPVKLKKLKKRTRHFNYFMFTDQKGNTLIRRRGKGDIWQGLYELPCVEAEAFLSKNAVKKNGIPGLWENHGVTFELNKIAERTHILTHQKIKAVLFELKIFKLPPINEFQEISINKLNNFAFPRLINLLLGN
ncbi:MAG: A/G-specific adenine glycosylase [Chitinophagales bacterium]